MAADPMNDRCMDGRFAGMPRVLLPDPSATGGGEAQRWRIVREGPRNLGAQPFDYRNPFPLRDARGAGQIEGNGPENVAGGWPLVDGPGAFDYYANGNAAIGLPGGPECALIDIHGTLRCLAGAWAFGLGEEAATPDLRVRRLDAGPAPIVLAEAERAGCRYVFEYFAAEIPGAPEADYLAVGNRSYGWIGGVEPRGRNLFLVVRCSVTTDAPSAKAMLHLGYAQAPALPAGAFYAGPRYAPAWERLRIEPTALGGQHCLLGEAGATEPAGATLLLARLDAGGAEVAPAAAALRHWPPPLSLAPQRLAALGLTARRKVGRARPWTLTWLIPLFALAADQAAAVMGAKPAQLRQRTARLWRSRRARGMQIRIPEAKVQDAFVQALNHLDLCSVRHERSEYPTPGPSGGHHIFYDRDSVDMIHAYDILGEHAQAERMIDQFVVRPVGQESSAMTLWLLGRHLAIAGTPAWARRMLPEAMRRMTWIVNTWAASRAENEGLLPATLIPDNELIEGHFVSYHLYAIAGAEAAVAMARAAGDHGLADRWDRFAADFRTAVLRRLERTVAQSHGVITPGFEGMAAKAVTVNVSWVEKPYSYTPAGAYGPTGGCDWHNLGAAFPTGVLPPDHPWIDSSLERWRHAYIEGAFPYPSKADYTMLHNYNMLNLSGTFLRRGDAAETVRDLYGTLLHTTATHASAEVVGSDYRHDFGCTPHNWFSGKLVRFIRDLLVYEGHDQSLHFLRGVSPAWLRPGQEIALEHAPTDLGAVSLSARTREGGMELALAHRAPRGRLGPRALVVHFPSFVNVRQVRVGDRRIDNPGSSVALPVQESTTLCVDWTADAWPEVSFDAVVRAYIEDYQRRVRALSV